jgi:hypothetical protein
MVFQKDLTPLRKGGPVKKQQGKGGSTFQPDPMARVTGRYPKPVSAPPAVTPAMPPGPMRPPLKDV